MCSQKFQQHGCRRAFEEVATIFALIIIGVLVVYVARIVFKGNNLYVGDSKTFEKGYWAGKDLDEFEAYASENIGSFMIDDRPIFMVIDSNGESFYLETRAIDLDHPFYRPLSEVEVHRLKTGGYKLTVLQGETVHLMQEK